MSGNAFSQEVPSGADAFDAAFTCQTAPWAGESKAIKNGSMHTAVPCAWRMRQTLME